MFALIIILLCCVFPAHAAYIRMSTRFTTQPTDYGVRLRLFIKNMGDEAAHVIQCEVVIASVTMHTDSIPLIQTGLEIHRDLFFKIRFPLPGRYPLVIKTVYRDKNGHRFSVLNCGFYVHAKPALPELIIGSGSADIPEKGKSAIDFIVRNTGVKVRDISFELYLSDELQADNDKIKIALAPKGRRKISFMITNLSALRGSSYALWLMGRYEDTKKKLHYTEYGTGMIKIKPQVSFLRVPQWVLIGADSILITLFILFQFKWLTSHFKFGRN